MGGFLIQVNVCLKGVSQRVCLNVRRRMTDVNGAAILCKWPTSDRQFC